MIVYLIYSQLRSMSTGRLVDPKYEDAPCRGERDAPVMAVQIIVGLLDKTSDL